MLPIKESSLASVLKRMNISDISCATIRQSGEIARTLERELGVEFLHLEMGIPGLPPAEVGVEAECLSEHEGSSGAEDTGFAFSQGVSGYRCGSVRLHTDSGIDAGKLHFVHSLLTP